MTSNPARTIELAIDLYARIFQCPIKIVFMIYRENHKPLSAPAHVLHVLNLIHRVLN
jgi:hypothetical protein